MAGDGEEREQSEIWLPVSLPRLAGEGLAPSAGRHGCVMIAADFGKETRSLAQVISGRGMEWCKELELDPSALRLLQETINLGREEGH